MAARDDAGPTARQDDVTEALTGPGASQAEPAEQAPGRARGRRRGLAIGAALAVGASVVGPAGTAAAAATSAHGTRQPLVAPSWPGLAAADPTAGVLEVAARGAAGAVTGTALAVTADGIAVTHRHLVDGATTIVVTDPVSGRRSLASVLVSDPRADMAVLQLVSATVADPAALRDDLVEDAPA